jgi:hypothetical protein
MAAGNYDAIVVGASFGGLAVARQLRGQRMRIGNTNDLRQRSLRPWAATEDRQHERPPAAVAPSMGCHRG